MDIEYVLSCLQVNLVIYLGFYVCLKQGLAAKARLNVYRRLSRITFTYKTGLLTME